MPSLIHLNGPPGIGKSTLAALYADRHPGALNLDIDTLHSLVGGWQDGDTHAHDILRPLSLSMASTHLAGGRDVILPQYLARIEEIERFERVADEQGAHFREVVLMDDKAASVTRFDQRQDDTAWGRHNRRAVASQGGSFFLEAMYDRLVEVVKPRPSAVVIHSKLDGVEATYRSLIEALSSTRPGRY